MPGSLTYHDDKSCANGYDLSATRCERSRKATANCFAAYRRHNLIAKSRSFRLL
jgi:hypothetical protein